MAKAKIERTALIKNITLNVLYLPEFTLGINETKEVEYTNKLRDYASEKLIKIIKIY